MKKIKWSFLLWILFAGFNPVHAQHNHIDLSGQVVDSTAGVELAYSTVQLKLLADSSFVSGTISNDKGVFILAGIEPGEYVLSCSYLGYHSSVLKVYVGSVSRNIDLGIIPLQSDQQVLGVAVVTAQKTEIGTALDKKSYAVTDNLSQQNGSVLQSISNLPGVTTQNGQIQLRGNSQVVVLVDGKQTAITGIGGQKGLENLPASAVERIEIINNPSAKYDANGNAGIINIILKKEVKEGFNGKIGLSAGVGALWVRKPNYPGIRPQYQQTPKVNPSISLNYRKKKVNLFFQADNLYSQTLNKNEFVTRSYADGTSIQQQLKRNRNTNFFTTRAGLDFFINEKNTLTVFGTFGQESIKDRGDQPFLNGTTLEQTRLWQFLEDELVTATMGSVSYEHRFDQPGRKITASANHTFDRENEKYFFDNQQSGRTTKESFALIADQKVLDLKVDYIRPVKQGVVESGLKFRRRTIPTNMVFYPSDSFSVLDTGADGRATYAEWIPSVYGTYIYESKRIQAEAGLRLEYVQLDYLVEPGHNTYQSDGYSYFQPFPNARLTYKLSKGKRLSVFYNRRVDRPDEVNIRIFPKYDDAGIIKVGNPALKPQFTNKVELGFKSDLPKGYVYAAVYRSMSNGTITRIATTIDASNLIYNVSQNIGKSSNSGVEVSLQHDASKRLKFNLNMNGYYNTIDAYTVTNQYPVSASFSEGKQTVYSGNVKLNSNISMSSTTEAQLTAIWLAPDILPQGSIASRFSMNIGVKKSVQKGLGEFVLNATDLFNTLKIRTTIHGKGFTYKSTDYYETQAIRLGYSRKF